MKRLLLFLSIAIFCAISGFSQVSNPIIPTCASITPGEDSEDSPYVLDSVDDVISIRFDVQPNVPATVVYSHVYYEGSEPKVNFNCEFVEVVDKVLNIQLDREKWGKPTKGMFNLEISVTFGYMRLNEDGSPQYEYYLDECGQPFLVERAYLLEDNFPPCVVSFTPNNSMFNGTFTFDDAFQYGIMDVYFSKRVSALRSVAVVAYYDNYGEFLDEFVTQLIREGWNDGYNRISFAFSNSDYSVDEIGKIEIQLSPVEWVNPQTNVTEVISLSPITLENRGNLHRKTKRLFAETNRDIAVGAMYSDVYDVNGRVVRSQFPLSEITNLPTGIYIAGGRKYVVK